MMLVALLLGLAGAPASAAPVPVPSQTAAPQRVLGLQGAANFRDIGGYRTGSGRSVRWGAVYRSNSLAALTPDDLARVRSLGLHSLVDFRTVAERQAAPDRWLARPAFVYESAKPSPAATIGPNLADARTGPAARAAITDFYAQMPDVYRPEYAALFAALARGGSEPLLMHCTAGKDRTGVATALLLTALGVPRETVVADYTLTARLLPTPPASLPAAGKSYGGLPPAARAAMWDADPAYIQAALSSVDREYGSIDGYVTRGLGLTADQLSAIRRNLLD